MGVPDGCRGSVACATAQGTNVGGVVGVEVAQLYVGFPDDAGEPKNILRGFVRTSDLQPGASEVMTFPLVARDLQIYCTETNGWRTPNGHYNVSIGASSRDLKLSSSLVACNGEVSAELGKP